MEWPWDSSLPGADLLVGAVDSHVHACPHITPRRLTAAESARQADVVGMRGIVLLDNFDDSSALAAEVQADPSISISVRGGIVLNHSVGLVTPEAVEASLAAGHGPAFVSLPTHHTRHSAMAEGRPHAEAESAFSVGEEIGRALGDVIDLVAQHHLVFNTGHVSADEALRVVRYAVDHGVDKVIVPAFDFALDTSRSLASAGATLEYTFFFASHAAGVPARHIDQLPTTVPYLPVNSVATRVSELGAEHCLISSDAGSALLPPPVEALRLFVASLLWLGVSEADLRLMVADNPARLFGLS